MMVSKRLEIIKELGLKPSFEYNSYVKGDFNIAFIDVRLMADEAFEEVVSKIKAEMLKRDKLDYYIIEGATINDDELRDSLVKIIFKLEYENYSDSDFRKLANDPAFIALKKLVNL
jgi:hypothetical protein